METSSVRRCSARIGGRRSAAATSGLRRASIYSCRASTSGLQSLTQMTMPRQSIKNANSVRPWQPLARKDDLMRIVLALLGLLSWVAPEILCASEPGKSVVAASMIEPASDAWPNVFVHQVTCNVYLLREGDSAILFNLGDGSILDHLKTIGVKNIEWIVFTDHHREQCQGIDRIDRATIKIAAPKEEQALFETPVQFRKWRPTLGDAHTVHGASYVRPPAAAIKLDRALADGELFTWRGHEITCVSTPGHSPGGMSYVLRNGDRACAFTGGVMHDGARMTNWFDTEWDYGFGKGLDVLIESVQQLSTLKLSSAFPAQGLRMPVNNSKTTTESSSNSALTTFAGIP